jgi:mannobiose 2-epimerase
LQEEARGVALRLARAARAEGQDEDGGLLYEVSADGTLDDDKHCWTQAEAIVGFMGAYELSGDEAFLDAAAACWSFTQAHVIDAEQGGWFFRVSRAGTPYREENKVGPWKGPYHSTRACLETVRRADTLREAEASRPPAFSGS